MRRYRLPERPTNSTSRRGLGSLAVIAGAPQPAARAVLPRHRPQTPHPRRSRTRRFSGIDIDGLSTIATSTTCWPGLWPPGGATTRSSTGTSGAGHLGHRDRQPHHRRRFGPAGRHRGAAAQPPVRQAARRSQAGQLAPGSLLLAAVTPQGRQHSLQKSDRQESTCSTTSSAAVLILKARGSCRVPGWLGRLGRSDGSGRRGIVPALPLRRMPADSISQLVAWRKRRPGRPSGAANTSASEA